MEDVTPFLPGDALAYLRIADGDRRFPFRPVAPGMFLIGHGPSCDLRLGMPGTPSIHTVIQLSPEVAEIIQVADQPPLLINGEQTARSVLHHGDLIEIGDVRLAFYLRDPAPIAISDSRPSPSSEDPRELVARLESEMALAGTFDSKRERILELLKAAQQTAESGHFAATLRFADYAAANDSQAGPADDAVQQLILARLNAQENRLEEICNVLEQVVQQQQLIATSLQCVVDRLDDLRTASQPGTFRASA